MLCAGDLPSHVFLMRGMAFPGACRCCDYHRSKSFELSLISLMLSAHKSKCALTTSLRKSPLVWPCSCARSATSLSKASNLCWRAFSPSSSRAFFLRRSSAVYKHKRNRPCETYCSSMRSSSFLYFSFVSSSTCFILALCASSTARRPSAYSLAHFVRS